jgi:protein-tyrosine phosphatase
MDCLVYTLSGDSQIGHFPWADPAHEQSQKARLELKNSVHKIKIDAYEAYRELPHPVLLHCSAGIDRSAPVAAFIVLTEQNINKMR